MNTNILAMETIALDDSERALVIIDQTKLPNCAEYLHLKTQGEIWTAIRELQVRGAPATTANSRAAFMRRPTT